MHINEIYEKLNVEVSELESELEFREKQSWVVKQSEKMREESERMVEELRGVRRRMEAWG